MWEAVGLSVRNGSSLSTRHRRDMRLARRILRKNEKAFRAFFSTYFPVVYRFCWARLRHTPGESEVEDIVQNVIVKGLRNLDGYRGDAALSTWLCQIARHEIASWGRRQGRRAAATSSIDDEGATEAFAGGEDSDPGDDVERRTAHAELVQIALARLPEDYGFALVQKYVAGCSVREIADLLGRSATATQSLLGRARTAFEEAYGDLQTETGERHER